LKVNLKITIKESISKDDLLNLIKEIDIEDPIIDIFDEEINEGIHVSLWTREETEKWINSLEKHYQLPKGSWYEKIKNEITSGAFLLNIKIEYLIESNIHKFHSGIIFDEIKKLQSKTIRNLQKGKNTTN
jgi:hypothetical protein